MTHETESPDTPGAVTTELVTVDLPGFTVLFELIAEHGGSSEQTPIAIETDRNLFATALAADFTVYPINPKALAAIGSGTARQVQSRIRPTQRCLL